MISVLGQWVAIAGKTIMAALRRALWILSILGALAGIYVMVQALLKAPTEQDLANCAIIAIAFALIPYCLARAVTESSSIRG